MTRFQHGNNADLQFESDPPDSVDEELLPDPVEAVESLRVASTWQEVVTRLAVGSYRYLAHVQVFLVHHNDLVGFVGLDGSRIDREVVRRRRLLLDGPSAVAQVLRSGVIFIGTPPPGDLSIQFLRAPGEDGRLAMVPVVVNKKPYCLLVGEPRPDVHRDEIRVPLARFAIEAGLVLTRKVVRHRRPSSPGIRRVSPRPTKGEARLDPVLLARMVEDLAEGGRRANKARRAIRRMSTAVLGDLVKLFPGKLHVGLDTPLESLPPPTECGPTLDALACVGPRALTAIGRLLGHRDIETRFFSTHLLSALFSPEAAVLAARQAEDQDRRVRKIALRTLRMFREQPGWVEVRQQLERYLRRPDPKGRAEACRTIGALRDPAVAPALLSALEDPEREVADAARQGLVVLTKQDFRLDARKWQGWWKENSWRDRVHWLAEGLVHKVSQVRASAATELEELMGHCYDYEVHLPKKARERIRIRCQEWWNFQKWWADSGIAEDPGVPVAHQLPAHEDGAGDELT